MIAQFSLRLLFGMSLMWGLMPWKRVSSGFFRIQMLVALAWSVLAALTLEPITAPTLAEPAILPPFVVRRICVGLAVAAFLGSVLWSLERRRAGAACGLLIAIGSVVALLLGSCSLGSIGSSSGVFYLLSELSSAWLLGAAVTGMLLGHWYLTVPSMSIAPLSRLTLYFAFAAIVRLALATTGLALEWGGISQNVYWSWLTLRWISGIVGPLIVAVMVWRILKYGNTQAATGMLFVGVILTFIGELTALLLYRGLSVPL